MAYKMALGFNKGDIGLVPTGGKKVVDIYHEITCKLFIDIVHNRITAYVFQTNLNPLTFAYTALG
jgi:hypothetical protein